MYIRPLLALALAFFVTIIVSPIRPAQADTITIGIIGDSNSDEYRADDNRAGGTIYAPTTLNWAELLAAKRGIDLGQWGTWGGERRTGYQYNWARTGATSQSMITNGQHTGLAQQISAGQIDYVIIYIGINDFHTWNGTYNQVYNGTLTNTQLQTKINTIVQRITTAVDTVRQAGNVGIVLANYADPGNSPDFRIAFPDANKRQRVTNAILQINQRLAELATSRGAIIADMYNYANFMLSLLDANGNLIIGGEAINLFVKGNEPHHLQLADSVGHPGTIASGMLANFFITALQQHGLQLTPFTDAELLTNAGIGVPPTATPSPIPTDLPLDTSTPIPTDLPLPNDTSTPVPTDTPIPTDTATPVPTDTPIPTDTATPIPTDTPIPTNTWIPTLVPSHTPTFTPTATLTSSPAPSLTPTPTATWTLTPSPTRTPSPVPTATPAATTKNIRIVSKPNNSLQNTFIFDGIVENGTVITEVTSPRFTYSAGWTARNNGGVNNSAYRYTTTASRTVTFTTTANSLSIMTSRRMGGGSFEVYVNNVRRVTYNTSAVFSSFVQVNIPLG